MGKLLDDAKASSEIKRINERLKDLARNFGTDSKIYQQLQNTIINATAVENRQARAYGKIARDVYGSVAERKQSELLGITDKRSFEFRSKMDQVMKGIAPLIKGKRVPIELVKYVTINIDGVPTVIPQIKNNKDARSQISEQQFGSMLAVPTSGQYKKKVREFQKSFPGVSDDLKKAAKQMEDINEGFTDEIAQFYGHAEMNPDIARLHAQKGSRKISYNEMYAMHSKYLSLKEKIRKASFPE